MTKNSEYGKRRRRARRTFLNTTGNCPGVAAHAFGEGVNGAAERSPKASFAFVPVLRFDQLGAGGGRENDGIA
jgi:hypothetical protein